MTMTLADALALADHASPLPHLAGEAPRVLRAELERLRAACHDCGCLYERFGLDLTLPHDQWSIISEGTNGLLCASCICRRAAELPGAIAVRASIEVLAAQQQWQAAACRWPSCECPNGTAECPKRTKADTAPPPSAPVGVETVDAAAWIEALELPEGFRVAEHLPGIWEYQFDIEDEADEDSDRMVSCASWNHPALAAIAAWGHAYDTLAQQPAAVDGAAVDRVAAALLEEATDEPWTVAGVEHEGPDRDYY